MNARQPVMDDREEQWRIEREAARLKRKEYLGKLFGTADPLDLHAPSPIVDFDALLGEHAAQLRSAVRYTMGYAIVDDTSHESRRDMIGSLTRLIQTNIAIAKVLVPRAKSKTVRGGANGEDAQD